MYSRVYKSYQACIPVLYVAVFLCFASGCSKQLIKSKDEPVLIPEFQTTRSLQIVQFINNTGEREHDVHRATIPKLIREGLVNVKRIWVPQQLVIQNKVAILKVHGEIEDDDEKLEKLETRKKLAELKELKKLAELEKLETPEQLEQLKELEQFKKLTTLKQLKTAQEHADIFRDHIELYEKEKQRFPLLFGLTTQHPTDLLASMSDLTIHKDVPNIFLSEPSLAEAFGELPSAQADLYMLGVLESDGNFLHVKTRLYDPHMARFFLEKDFRFSNDKFSITLHENMAQIIDAYTNALTQFPKGTLVVMSSPSGAEVFIDDKSRGRTTLKIDLAIGLHTLELLSPDHDKSSKKVFIQQNTETYESITLESKSKLSSLEITSSPLGAEVFLDLEYKGQTPLVIQGLEPETFKIRLEKEKYRTAYAEVSLKEHEQKVLAITLTEGETKYIPVHNLSKTLNTAKNIFLYSTLASTGIMLYAFVYEDYSRQKLRYTKLENREYWAGEHSEIKLFRTSTIISTVSFLALTTLFQILELHVEDIDVGFVVKSSEQAFFRENAGLLTSLALGFRF